MKTKLSRYAVQVIFCIALAISACKAIIEPSISDRKIVPIAPGDMTKATSYTVTFWWEPVEDALSYNLQVVSPSFNNISILVTGDKHKSAVWR